MEEFGFDKLPEVVRKLLMKVERIETMLEGMQTEQTVPANFLSVKEAADYLKISVPSIYSLTSRRMITVNKPGKKLYFSKVELDEWVKAGRRKTNDDINREAEAQLRSYKRR